MKKILLFTATLFLFSACSHKKVYEPQKVDKKISYAQEMKSEITDVSREGATLANGQVITRNAGLMELKIPEGFRYVNSIDDKGIIIVDAVGNIKMMDLEGNVHFEKEFETQIVSAALRGSLLAMVFSDNTIMLYNAEEDRLIYKEPLARVVTLDARLANPIFLNDLVVFATLDGRLLIMDTTKKLVLRDVAISDKEFFNNVIFLEVYNNRLIAATASKIIAIDPDNIRQIDMDVRDILYSGDELYVFTKNGRVVQLDDKLEIIKEIKFPNAVFTSVFENGAIYAVEKNGYLIKIDKGLETYSVMALPDEIEASNFSADQKIYYGKQIINIQ